MKLIWTGKFFFLLFLPFLLFQACNKKQFICAAYNSYFIHDQIERESFFSPFIIDSLSSVSSIYNIDNDSKKHVDVISDSLDESANSNSKYQPKEKLLKKLPNGLLVANSKKNKAIRGGDNVEMRIIMVKPLSRYSNIDSSSIKKEPILEPQETQSDTL